jgi:hypothetical protein
MEKYLFEFIAFIRDYTEIVIIVLFVISVVTLVILANTNKRLSKTIETYQNLMGGADAENLEAAVTENIRCVDSVRSNVTKIMEEHYEIKKLLNKSMQKLGMVRYNAFDDVGGEMSFSIALLDNQGNGVILSSIYGREEARVYAKPIAGGRSLYNLSEEEKQALRKALQEIAN